MQKACLGLIAIVFVTNKIFNHYDIAAKQKRRTKWLAYINSEWLFILKCLNIIQEKV
jgi:hypothetical protein